MVGLVGDIGGTNVRLALSLGPDQGQSFTSNMVVADFDHVCDAVGMMGRRLIVV